MTKQEARMLLLEEMERNEVLRASNRDVEVTPQMLEDWENGVGQYAEDSEFTRACEERMELLSRAREILGLR